MIAIVDVLKKRNNAVSNLTIGISSGLGLLDVPVKVLKYAQESLEGWRRIDPASIPENTEWLLVPYWISDGLWSINLREIKESHPGIRIAVYSGTSPFWHGSPKVSYIPGSKWLDPHGLSSEEKSNFEAVDLFLVVWPRPGVRPRNLFPIGMGTFPEIGCSPKSKRPTVVLDFLKQGWDECAYEDAAHCVLDLVREVPEVQIQVLGQNHLARQMFPTPSRNFICVPHSYIPFVEMCAIWRSAWAFVCHNESFGYPLIENWSSGTPVFTSRESEMPECHDPRSLAALPAHIMTWMTLEHEERDAEACNVAESYKSVFPEFASWKKAAERALAAMQAFDGGSCQ